MRPQRAAIARVLLLGLAMLACGPLGPARTPATGSAVPASPGTASPPPATSAPSATAPPPAGSPTTAPPASATAPATATDAWQPPEHVIGVRAADGRGEFYDRRTGQAFVPRGVNYVFAVDGAGRVTHYLLRVGVYDPVRTRGDFKQLAGLGYNTVRVFIDHCAAGPGCIGDADNDGLNPAYLDNLADLLAAARQAGLFLLLTSNDLPDQGGYSEQANSASGAHFAGYRNSYYLTEPAIQATRRYWRDLLTGLLQRQAAFDAVLGWQLLNEQWMFADQPPLSLAAGVVETATGAYDLADPAQKQRMVAEGLRRYIAEMRAEILAHDPTALVTMGFFAPGAGAPEWHVDTAPLLADSALDFFDFHAYPGEQPLAYYADRFGMLGYDERPILLGEYGAFRHRYDALPAAARALMGWVEESCALGFDGWLHWTHLPAGPEAGDRTWGFTDEDGFLLGLLAPANQPDACAPAPVPGDNLAFGRPVRVSSALPGEAPGQAVDDNLETWWGSGGHPPQWIEVDLGGETRLGEIRLLVAQHPEGATRHRLLLRGAAGDYSLAHEFSGPTRDGDWLVFQPAAPLEGIRYVRVETLSSPSWVSWREIRVFSAP